MKLHELLAVETGFENQANKTRTDLVNTFDKKRHLFEEKRTVFTPLGEGQTVVENQSDIQSTVAKEIAWLQPFLAKALDASYQVAQANTIAKADVVLEDEAGTTLLTGIPATSLLELEKRLVELAALVAAIPTLDPAKGFSPDPQRGEGYFQARQVRKTRSKKEKVVLIKYEATKEHPAQTELIDKDLPVGTIEEQEWSGLMTPAQKSDLINRVEIVYRAVRRARSRANEAEINQNAKIGAKLLGYIFGK